MRLGLGRLALTGQRRVVDPYLANGFSPEWFADFSAATDYFRRDGQKSTFADAVTWTRAGLGTMVDSDGLLKWGPHNLALNSAAPATQSVTVVSGADYTVGCTGSGSIALSGAGSGTVTEGNPVEVTASTTTLTLTVSGTVDLMWCYRSDLGGMAPVPLDQRVHPDLAYYVPTTTTAVYLPRRGHHKWNGSAWEKRGALGEPAATNLVLNSGTLSTQDVTVTAVAHTLSFVGTGRITLSGASTAGPLVGTGTGENNRVHLTFTPSAGTLTLTVSGTVERAQLEAGSVPSSYIPTSGSQVHLVADIIAPTADQLSDPRVIGEELVTNGGFDSADGWTVGANWSIADGVASIAAAGVSGTLEYTVSAPSTSRLYRLSFTFAGTGTIRPSLSGVFIGDLSAGSHVVYVYPSNTNGALTFRSQYGAAGTIDNISVREVDPTISILWEGDVSYADGGAADQAVLAARAANANNRLRLVLDTDSGGTGSVAAEQVASSTTDRVVGADTYAPGLMVPIKAAARFTASAVQVAHDGTAVAADETPTAVPNITAAPLTLTPTVPTILRQVGVWARDIGEAGIEEASS